MKAVVFVDVQKDFIDGALRNEKAIEVTPKIVEFAKECVEKGYKLYATRDTHEKTHLENLDGEGEAWRTGYLTTLEGEKLPVEHCIEGTDGWMIDERLWNVIAGKVTVVNKPTFGSFDLAEIIDDDAVKATTIYNELMSSIYLMKNTVLDEIILCGFVTSICLLANAIILRAKFPNIKITVMKDLCAGISNEDHEAAMIVLKMQQIDSELVTP